MGTATQPAPDDLHHFFSFLPDLHVDYASFNTSHDPIVYRAYFDLDCQLWLAASAQPGDPLPTTFSNQLKGV